MMRVLTNKEFLIGVAVGFFAVPLIMKHGRAQIERLRPATTNTTAA
jgi:hypothetical protein